LAALIKLPGVARRRTILALKVSRPNGGGIKPGDRA
jgi:hypothetical protein